MYFLRKIIFYFPSKEKIYFWLKKWHLSRLCTKDHIPMRSFWKDHLFRTFEENIIYPCIFLRNIIFHFLSKKQDHFFREKEISSFLILQERSYCKSIFLERPFFQNILKKKIWFFVQ